MSMAIHRMGAVTARRQAFGWVLIGFMFLAGVRGSAQALSEDTLVSIRFEQKLNAQVPLELRFKDEDGREVRLGQYFQSKPVVLVLGYYECPMLCTLVLNGMVESAADMKWSIGREFEVVNVSINPRETATLAAAKKRTYVKRYGRSGCAAGWHFLTGEAGAIRQLADAVGFRYAYDPTSKEYAHPSGLIVLTPQGRVSRYIFGVTYSPKDLNSALQAAAAQRVGSPIQQLLLLCFHYNPITGKYSGIIVVVLRVLGGATVLGMLWLVAWLLWRGRAAQASLMKSKPPAGDDVPAGVGMARPQKVFEGENSWREATAAPGDEPSPPLPRLPARNLQPKDRSSRP